MRVLDENTNVYWRRRIVSLDASSLSVGTKKTEKKKNLKTNYKQMNLLYSYI